MPLNAQIKGCGRGDVVDKSRQENIVRDLFAALQHADCARAARIHKILGKCRLNVLVINVILSSFLRHEEWEAMMIDPVSDRIPGHRATAARRRCDKPVLRVHLAQLARSLSLGRQRRSPRGIAAADMFVARRHAKR